jgi:hypothetical protein
MWQRKEARKGHQACPVLLVAAANHRSIAVVVSGPKEIPLGIPTQV